MSRFACRRSAEKRAFILGVICTVALQLFLRLFYDAHTTTGRPAAAAAGLLMPSRGRNCASPNGAASGNCLLTCERAGTRRQAYFIAPKFHGRLGTLLFIYASTYALSRCYGRVMVLTNNWQPFLSHFRPINSQDPYLMEVDQINTTSYTTLYDSMPCRKSSVLVERLSVRSNVFLIGYLQSWRYFHDIRALIIERFRFTASVQLMANGILRRAYAHSKYQLPISDAVLVGVHVRRADLVRNGVLKRHGYQVAPQSYLAKATAYYMQRFSNVIFIVATDDHKWTSQWFPKVRAHVEFIRNDPIVDFATLTLCNHTIHTVGSFGWWVSYLNGGEAVYYSKPYRRGSKLEAEFGHSTEDFFPPEWIGIGD